jgi:hypothetical protein
LAKQTKHRKTDTRYLKTQQADRAGGGDPCDHAPDLLILQRLRRELTREQRDRARCNVCEKAFRAFLLQCRGCGTLMCLDCRDGLRDGMSREDLAGAFAAPSTGEGA